MEYIPIRVIRQELKRHFDTFDRCTSIPAICKTLKKNGSPEIVMEYSNPFPEDIADRDDETFMKCFAESLYPLSKTLDAISGDDAFSYLAETIFSRQFLFMIFLHENYALQTFHSHDYFEISYVFRGICRLSFDNESLHLAEGNICIIPPGLKHEAFVLDSDSFVINMSMTREAFEAAFAPILVRQDLISYYIQKILYQQKNTNYLFIPSTNSIRMKRAIKQMTYEHRTNQYDSFSSCISWLSVFISDLFRSYRTNSGIPQENRSSSHTDYLALLEYIQNHFRDITLESMAKHFHYNKSYLSRLILKITGRSFVEIITDMKLKIGKELLENTELTLDQIAEFIGYRSGDYFSKVFKRVCGCSAAIHRIQKSTGIT